jgi:hypothetical protein
MNGDIILGHAIAQAVSRWLPTAAARFEPRPGYVGFVIIKVALRQVFSEHLSFPCHSFHRLLHSHHHHPSSGTGTVDQIVSDVPHGLSLTPPQETNKLTTDTVLKQFG